MKHAMTCTLPTLGLLLCLTAGAARAEERRVALLIGNNLGEPGEVPLLYAERDVQRMQETLEGYGGFASGDVLVLKGRTEQDVRDALEKIEATIEAAKSDDDEILFLFYYSGHADRSAMHLSGTLLSFSDVREELDAMDASLRIIIVDACQSGSLTRVKGAGPAKPFRIEQMEQGSGEGTAILTSAAAGEDAQESEHLQGSFFTYHLLAGLIGAADSSNDGQVTLTEAYQYAYSETLRDTSELQHIQHPTYSFKIKGRQDVILSRLEAKSGDGQLQLDQAGQYFIFSDSERGELVTEFTTARKMKLMLPGGRYFVRRRVKDKIYEGSIAIKERETASMSSSHFTQVPYRQVALKGYDFQQAAELPVHYSVQLGYSNRSAPLQDFSQMQGVHAALFQERGKWSFGIGLEVQRSVARASPLSISQYAWSAEFEVARALALRQFTLWGGVHAGPTLFDQRFTEESGEANRQGIAAKLGLRTRLFWNVTPSLAPYLFAEGDSWVYQNAQRQPSYNLGWAGGLGISWLFRRGETNE